MTDLSDIVSSAFWRVNPPDADPVETREWIEALDALIETEGRERATFLLRRLLQHARARRVPLPQVLATPYVNTIGLAEQPPYQGNLEIEARISALVRWNALAMVVRANREYAELGGHIASYASAADLFEVGFNHFFRAGATSSTSSRTRRRASTRARSSRGGSPRRTSTHYRRETGGKGLSSYCHPWLMPDFWQFPTGSMGLGPLFAIYQARFMRYLEHRGSCETDKRRKVWAFVGDGEMDEPESLAGLSIAARERLDNLVLRRQLQPAAPRRPGARQRLDRAGAGGPLRRRRLERDQAAVGRRLGSALRARHARRAARSASSRPSTASSRPTPRPTALQPRALLQQVPRAAAS